MLLTDTLVIHFRLTTHQRKALKRLGIETVEDLLRHIPRRYESSTEATQINNLKKGQKVMLYGTFTKVEAKKLWRSRIPATEGVFKDQSGKIKIIWFNQPYISKMITVNSPVKITGSVAGNERSLYITNPEVEAMYSSAVPQNLFSTNTKALNADISFFPVYEESRGITSRWFYHAVRKVFKSGVLDKIQDPIPEGILKQYHLPTLRDALVWIHTPKKKSHTEIARKRFSFEEIFIIQVAKTQDRKENNLYGTYKISSHKRNMAKFINSLPYKLTKAQDRAISEILKDISQDKPMARLLEGDVGSGKTAVAAATSYAVVTNKPHRRKSGTLQVAYMAPTEILAKQHLNSFIEMFSFLPVNIGLITGKACFKFPSKTDKSKPTKISKTQLLKWVKNGEIAILIGTHSLIQKKVEFQNLSYVIVDEQHRFGTAQRKALVRKSGLMPHFLSMTATPIPRTLALTLYGDLDLSVLDELPPGRASVTTTIVSGNAREAMYNEIRKELKKGRQVYVVCPRIDEPDSDKAFALRVKSAVAEASRLQKQEFANYKVGLIHGKLTPKEKETIMNEFVNNKYKILVATSVIEVGINVPNATTILIEGAERFGLAQLHQLRGRVLRSSYPALCFLLPSKMGPSAKSRLSALTKTQNGFKLAETDLKNRGAGYLYGDKQWGISDLGMEALQNPRLIESARVEAQKLVKNDTRLEKHKKLLEETKRIRNTLHDE